MCKRLLQSLLIWLDEAQLHIYKEMTINQSPVEGLPQAHVFSSFYLEIHACLGKTQLT